MDLDTTIKGLNVTHEDIRNIFSDICSVEIADDIEFEIVSITDIREGDDYPGIRVALKANYMPLSVPLTVDVTTGDKITPREIEYTFKLLFDERSIKIMAYNLESILAEKIETILSRGVASTRPRDYYDIFALSTLRKPTYDIATLKDALKATAIKRGSMKSILNYRAIIDELESSSKQQGFWKKYQSDFDYAKNISFEDIITIVRNILDNLNLDK